MPLVEIVLLREFAAFWAAEIIDEKKLEAAGVELADTSLAVGAGGGRVMLETLLGAMLVLDPERDGWVLVVMLPDDKVSLSRGEDCGPSAAAFGALLVGDVWVRGGTRSVGVAGVLTITGAGGLLEEGDLRGALADKSMVGFFCFACE